MIKNIILSIITLCYITYAKTITLKYDYWYGGQIIVTLKELPRDKESFVSSNNVKFSEKNYLTRIEYKSNGLEWISNISEISFYDKDKFEIGSLNTRYNKLVLENTYDLIIKGKEPPVSILPVISLKCLIGYHNPPECESDLGMVLINDIWDSLPENSYKIDNNTYKCITGYAISNNECLTESEISCIDTTRTHVIDNGKWICRKKLPVNTYWDYYLEKPMCISGSAFNKYGECVYSFDCDYGQLSYIENNTWHCPNFNWPSNAKWNGNEFECNKGYYTDIDKIRDYRILCKKEVLQGPKNAHWDEIQKKWVCNNGTIKLKSGCFINDNKVKNDNIIEQEQKKGLIIVSFSVVFILLVFLR